MGYREGEGVLDQSYCEADVLRGAGKNINRFIEVIIAIALGLAILGALGSTLVGMLSCFGGCLGCDACIETAACADDCMDDVSCGECGNSGYGEYGCWEEKTRENIQKADDCASCEGIDCFGRQGCFSCGGCGDCADCNGTKYYSITIHDGGSTTDLSVDEDYNYITSVYNLKKSSKYYKFIGMYDKESGGKCYVDENGEIVKKLKNGLNLYARYEERNVGVEYHFHLKLEAFGMDDKTIALQVGGPLTGLPVAPEKEGYSFVGWYIKDKRIFTGNVQEGMEFHLSTFGIDPYTDEREFTLYPKYEPKKYTVTFRVRNNSYQGGYSEYEIIANYGDTYANAYAAFDDEYYVISDDDNFFGWGMNSTSEPEDRIGGEATITGDVTLYAILREAIHLEFRYNTGKYDEPSAIDVKVQEGKVNVRLSELPELAIFATEDANPGYEFIGWYTTSSPDDDDVPVQQIDRISLNTPRMYYAQWRKATYTIEYYYKDYANNTVNEVDSATYQMSSQALSLKEYTDGMYNIGYDFIGWKERGTSNGPTMTLAANAYGNKIMDAVYESDQYTINLRAMQGKFLSSGSNIGTETIDYGGAYRLSIPYREGYDFVGWYYGTRSDIANSIKMTDGNGDSLQPFTLTSLGLPLTKDAENTLNHQAEMWAYYTIKTFTVTFMVDGDVHGRVTVNWNTNLVGKMPETPSKTGYSFVSWKYTNGGEFDPSTPITENVTVKANFNILQYAVTFVVDGDYVDDNNYVVYVDHGTTVEVAEGRIVGKSDDELLHRRRLGLYADSSYLTRVWESDKITKNTTIYIKYLDAYKFTFHFDNNSTQTQYYFKGDVEDFPADSARGYEFKGWRADEYSAVLWKDVKITEGMATTYYAYHEAIAYDIRYFIGSSERTDWKTTYTVEDNVTLKTFDADVVLKAGYRFTGWKINDAGEILAGWSAKDRTGEVKLYAQFTPRNYVVTLCEEGNDAKKTVIFDAPLSLGVPSGDKEGYDFKGWTWSDSTSDEVRKNNLFTDENGNSLPNVTYTTASNRNAYPYFEIKKYDVQWIDAETGNVLETTKNAHFSQLPNRTDVVKEGYTFVAWYKDQACSEIYDFSTETVTGTLKIYGKFTINKYTVTFDVGGTKTIKEVEYNASLSTVFSEMQASVNAYVAATEGRFQYWYEDNIIYYESTKMPARNLTLTAHFDMPIQVSFYDHKDQAIKTLTLYKGDTIGNHSYTRVGYTFQGWYTDKSWMSSKKQEFPLTVDKSSGSYAFYPKWKANEYSITYYIDGQYEKVVTYTMDETEKLSGLTLWTPSAAEHKGQVFDGWYSQYGEWTGATDVINNSGKADGQKIYGNIVCTGTWKPATYTVTFKSNGDVWKTMEVQYGDILTNIVFPQEMIPNGKYLDCWVLEDSSTLVIDSSGQWNYSTYVWDHDIVLVAEYWDL